MRLDPKIRLSSHLPIVNQWPFQVGSSVVVLLVDCFNISLGAVFADVINIA